MCIRGRTAVLGMSRGMPGVGMRNAQWVIRSWLQRSALPEPDIRNGRALGYSHRAWVPSTTACDTCMRQRAHGMAILASARTGIAIEQGHQPDGQQVD